MKFKKLIIAIFVLAIITLPVLSFAAPPSGLSEKVCNATVEDVGDVICKIGSILGIIIPVLITLGVVYFVFGVVTYVISSDEEAKKSGRNRMIYGIIGFVVIFALKGLIAIVINTFGLDQINSGIVSNLIQENADVIRYGGCDFPTDNPKFGNVLNYATCLINNSVIPLIASLAVAMFIWGVIQYVINNDEEAKKEKGKQFMIWGVIGLAVMFGVWGLVRIVGTTFGIQYAIPQLKQ